MEFDSGVGPTFFFVTFFMELMLGSKKLMGAFLGPLSAILDFAVGAAL